MPDSSLPGFPALPDQPPKLTVAWLMTDVVSLVIKDIGFAQNALTFVRRRADLVDVINLQGSTRNGQLEHSFFINVDDRRLTRYRRSLRDGLEVGRTGR